MVYCRAKLGLSMCTLNPGGFAHSLDWVLGCAARFVERITKYASVTA